MKANYLECGKITNTHGVRGAVTVDSYCDSRAVFASLPAVYRRRGDDYIPLKMRSAVPHKNLVLVSFEGIDTLNDAILLKGETIYAARADVPLAPGAYFLADLIGLPVRNADSGKVYGTIEATDEVAGRRIYTIRTEGGRDVLFPAVDEFIARVDTDDALYIRPIEGFFDEI